jgi:hypothetical protein
MQPCQGIAWWAHRDDDRQRGNQFLALLSNPIGSKDPDALKIPSRRAEYSLTESASSPVQAEPRAAERKTGGRPADELSLSMSRCKYKCGFLAVRFSAERHPRSSLDHLTQIFPVNGGLIEAKGKKA